MTEKNADFRDSCVSLPAGRTWCVYIILCSDNSLYTGITQNPDRRLLQHATGRGAKYFRGRRPLSMVYLEEGHDRCSAARREAEIKKLKPAEKRRLMAAPRPVSPTPPPAV